MLMLMLMLMLRAPQEAEGSLQAAEVQMCPEVTLLLQLGAALQRPALPGDTPGPGCCSLGCPKGPQGDWEPLPTSQAEIP